MRRQRARATEGGTLMRKVTFLAGMNRGHALVVIVLVIAGCGGRSGDVDPGLAQGCETDLECKGDRVCVDHECQSPALRGFAGSGGGFGHGGATSSGGRASSAGAGGGDSGIASTSLAIEASALVADSARKRLYAVVTGKAATHANELVVVDASGNVEASMVIGSDPDSLALSQDGTRLWVGIHGAFSVREVDVTQSPPKPGASYVLPPGQFAHDAVHAGPMVALPGAPESIAASLHYDGLSPSLAGVVVLDAGNPRAKLTPGHTGASRLTSGPPGYLFGFNNLHTGFGFYSVVVDATGAVQTEHDGLVDGFDNDIVYDSGFVLATGGEVIDVSRPDQPSRAGKFSQTGLIVPHVAQKQALMLSVVSGSGYPSGFDSPNRLVLRRLNLETFREDEERMLAGNFAKVRDFVELGPGSYAFVEFQDDSFNSTSKPPSVHLLSVPEFE